MDKVTTKKAKNKPKNKEIGSHKKPFKPKTTEKSMDTSEIVNFLWEKQDFLRTYYSKSEYKNVILPMVVLTRLDIELKKTKPKVLEKIKELEKKNIKKDSMDDDLNEITGTKHYNNKSQFLDLSDLLSDPNDIKDNLLDYINGFSNNIIDVFDKFRFKNEINYLDSKGILWKTIEHFVKYEKELSAFDNHDMGTVYEELIRKANEDSATTAGQFFTPRDVVSVLTSIVFSPDVSKILKEPDTLRIIYDPAAGTGGMLTESLKFLQDNISKEIKLGLAGQESEDKIFAVCKSDLMMRGIDPKNVQSGNTLTDEDKFSNHKFDYILSNPPYGSKWKDFEEEIKNEKNKPDTRYPCKLPGIGDSALLFLQHIVSKMHPQDSEKTSRAAVILNGSPLDLGDAGSGESQIRKWLIDELDYLETIITLPKDLFYNTGISTYVLILTNHKSKERKGKIQIINASKLCTRLRRGLSHKRYEIEPSHIDEIKSNYESFPKESNISKIFDNKKFGYTQIIVDRPLRRTYSFTNEKIEMLKTQSAFTKLSISTKKGATAKAKEEEQGRKKQNEIISVLKSANKSNVYKDCKEIEKVIVDLFEKSKVEISKGILKTIQKTLSEHDDSVEPCMHGKTPVYDSELRDTEKIPLLEDIDKYFEREVLHYVPDAKIVESSRTNIGYEIPMTQLFYEYIPLRSLKEIDSDIKKLQEVISSDLKDLMS